MIVLHVLNWPFQDQTNLENLPINSLDRKNDRKQRAISLLNYHNKMIVAYAQWSHILVHMICILTVMLKTLHFPLYQKAWDPFNRIQIIHSLFTHLAVLLSTARSIFRNHSIYFQYILVHGKNSFTHPPTTTDCQQSCRVPGNKNAFIHSIFLAVGTRLKKSDT